MDTKKLKKEFEKQIREHSFIWEGTGRLDNTWEWLWPFIETAITKAKSGERERIIKEIERAIDDITQLEGSDFGLYKVLELLTQDK